MVLACIYEGINVFPRYRVHISCLGRCGHIPAHLSLHTGAVFFFVWRCYSPIIDVDLSEDDTSSTLPVLLWDVDARPSLMGPDLVMDRPYHFALVQASLELILSLFLKCFCTFLRVQSGYFFQHWYFKFMLSLSFPLPLPHFWPCSGLFLSGICV